MCRHCESYTRAVAFGRMLICELTDVCMHHKQGYRTRHICLCAYALQPSALLAEACCCTCHGRLRPCLLAASTQTFSRWRAHCMADMCVEELACTCPTGYDAGLAANGAIHSELQLEDRKSVV